MKRTWLVVVCIAGISMMAIRPGYAQTRQPKLATTISTGSSAWQALEFWQKELARTNWDRVVVQMFPDSQLGAEQTITPGVRFGHVEIALLSLDSLLTLSPELRTVEIPGRILPPAGVAGTMVVTYARVARTSVPLSTISVILTWLDVPS